MPKAEGKKAATRSGNYQDNITTPLACKHDCDATANDEIDDTVDLDGEAEAASSMLSAIERVSVIWPFYELDRN
jgi:hypothetical protein